MLKRMWLAMVLLVSACSGADVAATTEPVSPVTTTTTVPATTSTTVDARESLSSEAAAYLDEALALMREWSINRDSVDWGLVEESAFGVATGAQSPAGTHSAINLALQMLRDEHSVFLPPEQADSFSHGPAVFTTPEVEVRPEGVGYVSIGRYLGDIGEQADEYAADLAARIQGGTSQTCGWILDLRANNGGNMWPMLAGLAPLLGQGIVGSFTYPNGLVEPWEINGSVAMWDEAAMTDNSLDDPVGLGQPVAVLIGSLTGSSGEAVAVAFHGQDGVRFFGQPTAGRTTSNEPLELSDGAIIALTMSNFTDRLGRQYGQSIAVEPDQPTATPADAETAALVWLLGQSACSG